ncbi:hypothetical protein [Hyalangium rubrum]|uniref:Uncharacterized protein n=1 Tax=Hyalangium rubrum TaxID=3103134 RepID=A0ABU5H6A2_9BACT|nr:hypothetical protein [Hyalangium sp. s54d21]MDY7228373.1 hypothetical protein [Hyalangium sp. s54d21]
MPLNEFFDASHPWADQNGQRILLSGSCRSSTGGSGEEVSE